MKTLRIWIARYRLMGAEFDVAYWQSARDTAAANLARAQRRVNLLRQLPNEIRFRLPSGLTRRMP